MSHGRSIAAVALVLLAAGACSSTEEVANGASPSQTSTLGVQTGTSEVESPSTTTARTTTAPTTTTGAGEDSSREKQPIQQRPGQPSPVTIDRPRGADARHLTVFVETARAGIRCRHELNLAPKCHGRSLACHNDASIFNRLAQCIEKRSEKLAQLVEKQDAPMSQYPSKLPR